MKLDNDQLVDLRHRAERRCVLPKWTHSWTALDIGTLLSPADLLRGDFNGDGFTDILIRYPAGGSSSI